MEEKVATINRNAGNLPPEWVAPFTGIRIPVETAAQHQDRGLLSHPAQISGKRIPMYASATAIEKW